MTSNVENQENNVAENKSAEPAPEKVNVIDEFNKAGNAVLFKMNQKIDDALVLISDSLKANAQRILNEELNKLLSTLFKKE